MPLDAKNCIPRAVMYMTKQFIAILTKISPKTTLRKKLAKISLITLFSLPFQITLNLRLIKH